MTAIVKPKPALDEFLKLPETEPASEFLEGQIIQKPMPQGEHSVLQGELCKTCNLKAVYTTLTDIVDISDKIK